MILFKTRLQLEVGHLLRVIRDKFRSQLSHLINSAQSRSVRQETFTLSPERLSFNLYQGWKTSSCEQMCYLYYFLIIKLLPMHPYQPISFCLIWTRISDRFDPLTAVFGYSVDWVFDQLGQRARVQKSLQRLPTRLLSLLPYWTCLVSTATSSSILFY